MLFHSLFHVIYAIFFAFIINNNTRQLQDFVMKPAMHTIRQQLLLLQQPVSICYSHHQRQLYCASERMQRLENEKKEEEADDEQKEEKGEDKEEEEEAEK